MKLLHQIVAATVGTLLAVVALVAGLSYLSVERGFARYVRSLEEDRLKVPLRRLAERYRSDGTWARLADEPKTFKRMLRREDDREPPPERLEQERREREDSRERDERRERKERKSRDPLELPPRVTLYDAKGQRVIGTGTPATDASRLAIVLDDRTVGWLGVRAIDRFNDLLDLHYMNHVRRDVLLVAAAALVLGLLAAVLLARRVVRPVVALRDATRRLAQGDYDARLDFHSRDELGDLTRDFDTLAATLATHERVRRQWVADISHELRTPVTILRAEVEAMLDGVRPIDRTGVSSLDAELQRLSQLVGDLAQLAKAEQTAAVLVRTPVQLAALVKQTVEAFAGRLTRSGLRLSVDLAAIEGERVAADPTRLAQVFANLLENALRYTDRNGEVQVSAERTADGVLVRIDDSAPGVSDADLPLLCDRLFRVEASRSRDHGGAGLGLAICQQWVARHGGTLTLAHSPLGGLRVEVHLPASHHEEAPA